MLQNGCGFFEPSRICLVLQFNPNTGAIAEGGAVFKLPGIVPDDLGAADGRMLTRSQFTLHLADGSQEFFLGGWGNAILIV